MRPAKKKSRTWRETKMASVRDNQDASRREYISAYGAELATQRQAAEDSDPFKRAARSMDEVATATKDSILNGRLSEEALPGEKIQGRAVDSDVAAQNFRWWAHNTGKNEGFQNYMASVLLDAIIKQDMAPVAENFSRVFQLLKEYNLLPEAAPALT